MNTYLNTNLQLPKGLILEDCIKGYKPAWRDKYAWFINSILYKKYTIGATEAEYVPLKYDLLAEYLGTDYTTDVIAQLLNSGIINRSNYYVPGHKSRGYRLATKWRGRELVNVKLSSKKKEEQYFGKVLKYKAQELKKLFQTNPLIQAEFRKLTEWRIDVFKAARYVDANFKPNSDNYKTYMRAIREFDAMHKTSFADGFYNFNFMFIVKGGRIYTPVTSLPRLLEPFKYKDGAKDVPINGLDMPSSQIKFYDLVINGQPKDEANFLDWQKVIWDENADPYTTLMSLCYYNGKDCDHSKEERHTFKREVFWKELYYNKYNPSRLTRLEKVFKHYFPQYFKQLQSVKKELGEDGNKKLARRIHLAEGNFFHGVIVNHFEKNRKDLSYVIKHDCVYIPQTEIDAVKPELDALASNYFGINIKLEIE